VALNRVRNKSHAFLPQSHRAALFQDSACYDGADRGTVPSNTPFADAQLRQGQVAMLSTR